VTHESEVAQLRIQVRALEAELASVREALDTPDQEDFLAASVAEAKYQRTRWSESDATKTDSDWFWLVGYLVSKAMHDVRGKRVHHLTAAGAALANWHASAVSRGEQMPEERGDQADHTGRVS
jgi:hypothetical protein